MKQRKTKPFRDRKEFIRKKAFLKRLSGGVKFQFKGGRKAPVGFFSGLPQIKDGTKNSLVKSLLEQMGFKVK